MQMRMIHNNICDVNVFALIQVNSHWEIVEKDGRDQACCVAENQPWFLKWACGRLQCLYSNFEPG